MTVNMFWLGCIILLTNAKISLSKCGQGSSVILQDKIVGGRSAFDGEFPWQASLQRETSKGYFHTCGASLVTSEWLVTAAHCITSIYVDSYRVVIGSNSLSKSNESSKFVHFVRTIVIKQGFDHDTFYNDIALLQIFPPAKSIDCICLPDTQPDVDLPAVVLGWGATTDGGPASDVLQVAQVGIIPRIECMEYYGSLVLDTMMCAGYLEGTIDSCQGDSGGPLLHILNGTAYLIGVVSWGIGCAEPLHPGVYTDVYKFANWIRHYVFS